MNQSDTIKFYTLLEGKYGRDFIDTFEERLTEYHPMRLETALERVEEGLGSIARAAGKGVMNFGRGAANNSSAGSGIAAKSGRSARRMVRGFQGKGDDTGGQRTLSHGIGKTVGSFAKRSMGGGDGDPADAAGKLGAGVNKGVRKMGSGIKAAAGGGMRSLRKLGKSSGISKPGEGEEMSRNQSRRMMRSGSFNRNRDRKR